MPEITKNVDVLKIKDNTTVEVTDTVATEHDLRIFLNDKHCADLVCTPCNLEELAIGYLYSSGAILNKNNIIDPELTDDNEAIYVKTTQKNPTGKASLPLQAPFETAAYKPNVALSKLLSCMESFLNKSKTFQLTGSVHSCALVHNSSLKCFMEDIGRHNAFDKTIGAALRADILLDEAIVLTTGRIPADMMMKIINSRIPIAVTRSAPTDAAIELAKQHGITLCGFARGSRINIYNGKERVIVQA
jgi:FdhD protein